MCTSQSSGINEWIDPGGVATREIFGADSWVAEAEDPFGLFTEAEEVEDADIAAEAEVAATASESSSAAYIAAQKKAAAASMSGTLLTGSRGLTTEATTQKQTLLGS